MTDEAWLAEFADRNGYLAPRLLPGDRYAAVMPLAFTAAIIVGEVGNEFSYLDRWCYVRGPAAILALAVWDGEGDPAGWHRHPKSGRRVACTEGEVDEHGQLVAVGEVYVRD
jgi:hypothetical protein